MTTNTPPRSVALHVGVHKTATTHLQRSFGAQQSALIAAGIRYYGPENLRRPTKGLGEIFGLGIHKSAGPPKRSCADQADFMFKDGHRLILSDENFIGVLHDRSGKIVTPLYPHAEKRITALATALNAGPIDLFLGLRNPASFIASAYGQALLGGKPLSFSDYIAQNPVAQIYWPDLVSRLRATQGVGHIYVWEYEDYRWRFYDICAAMMGPDVAMRIMPFPDRVHRGLSEAAVVEILAQAPEDSARDVADGARTAYPAGAKYPSFDPFHIQDKTAAAASYARQIAEIETISGVTVLRP